MDKATLFELIRGEEVLLWAGSGLSLYAGYASGKRTAEILFESFPDAFKNDLDANKPLPQFVEDYVNLQSGNLNRLVRVLNKLFLASPTSTEHHQIIASIPHIHNIITTNYDRLFELAYGGNRLYTVLSNNNLTYLDKSKTTLFKIHGDLQDPDSVLIAAKDYRKFFIDKQGQPLWKYIESMLSTKAVVFIGYSLDDINILTMYEKLAEAFKDHMPPAYFVSPSIPRVKQKELDRLKITYIPLTGEAFFAELYENIKDSIVNDVEVGRTSADTFKRFMDYHELRANLVGSDDGFDVSKIEKVTGGTTAKIHLKMNQNQYLLDKFIEVTSGFGYEPLTLSLNDLQGADLRIEDLKVPLNGRREFQFVLSPAPLHEGLYDVFFDDFELYQLKVKIFRAPAGVKVIIKIHTATLTFDVEFGQGEMNSNFTLENKLENSDCPLTSTKEQIEIYTLASELCSGKTLKYFSHSTQSVHTLQPAEVVSNPSKQYANYFKKLRDIERTFDFRFNSFKSINEDAKEALRLHQAISGAVEEAEGDIEIPLTLDDVSGQEVLKRLNINQGSDTILNEIGAFEFMIHGKSIKINITRSFKFLNPVVFKSEGGDYHLRSANNKFIVTHSCSPYSQV